VPGFDPASYGLVPLPLEVWHGWVFVNATADAASFDDHVGAMGGLVAPYAPERLRLLARHEYVIAANWKIAVENYHECYHCPLIHPELCQVSPPSSGSNFDLPGAWVGGSMDLREHAETMSLDGRSRGVPIDGAHPRQVLYLGLFPSLLVSLHPDYVLVHRAQPLAIDRTRIVCNWYFHPDAMAAPGFDPQPAIDFWDLTNRQDWALCENAYRGVRSQAWEPGPYSELESQLAAFDRYYLKQLGDLPQSHQGTLA